MIDPTEVSSGDVLTVEMMTVYQDIGSDPYVIDLEVFEVESYVDEDDGTEVVDLYFEYKRDENDGYPIRRVRFRGPNPEYQQARGDVDDPTWAKFSRDDYCNVRESEESDADEAEESDADEAEESDADEAEESDAEPVEA